ncbi:MAG: NAD(P)/FAD-dependent oxidoreductase [Coriobacteriia bacterium]|nr:NAD(P)/FAD-dependent oxidoreductase [Coriobacteriia bacterium]
MRDSYDAVIVGAGPAGVMAAVQAAKAGSVLVVDSSRFPRDKSCGGMLHEDSQTFLESIAPIPRETVLQPAHVCFRYVDWDRGIRKSTDLRFLNVDRRAFDVWLLGLLPQGVDVEQRTTLEGLEQHNGHVRLRLQTPDGGRTVTCTSVVGADGARSRTRRALGNGSVETYVTLQDFVRLDGELEPYFDCIYMRGIGDCFAYSYVVPKGETAIVGSVYYPKTRRPHEKQDQTLGILREAMPQLGETVRREACTALSVRTPADISPGSGRVLLAGEAGGFMSPTSGEGISYALRTGLLAGRAVAESAPGEALADYARATASISADIRRRLRWLPVMESTIGKYLAGLVPAPIVSRVTRGL